MKKILFSLSVIFLLLSWINTVYSWYEKINEDIFNNFWSTGFPTYGSWYIKHDSAFDKYKKELSIFWIDGMICKYISYYYESKDWDIYFSCWKELSNKQISRSVYINSEIILNDYIWDNISNIKIKWNLIIIDAVGSYIASWWNRITYEYIFETENEIYNEIYKVRRNMVEKGFDKYIPLLDKFTRELPNDKLDYVLKKIETILIKDIWETKYEDIYYFLKIKILIEKIKREI